MLTDFRRLNMQPTRGASDSDPGPKGRPRTTGDFREKYNIQNLLTRALLPPGEKEWHDKQRDNRERGGNDAKQDDNTIELIQNYAMLFAVVVGGILVYKYIL